MKSSRKSLAVLPGSLLILLLCATGLAALWLWQQNRFPEAPYVDLALEGIEQGEGGVLVRVERGESITAVSSRLVEAGLTRSVVLWKLFARVYGDPLMAGQYLVKTPISALDLYRQLSSGKVVLTRVTVPEGLTLEKTAKRLEAVGLCTSGDFLSAAASKELIAKYAIPSDTLEGYLYPETYHFPEGYPARRIVEDMVALHFKTLDEIHPAHRNLSPDERHEKLILASIVEREAYLKEEAPLIAGVFYNRIAIDMPLQSCATVEYILTEIMGRPHPQRLYDVDIAINHPFNTYVNAGLPPGPIASPGKTALRSVYEPEKSDYLYFRLIDANRGEHAFSKNYEEHLEYGLLFNKRNRNP